MCSSFRRSTVAGAPPDVGNPPPRALLGAIDRFVAGKTVPRCAGLDSKAQVDAASLWELDKGSGAHELGSSAKEEPKGVLLHREEHRQVLLPMRKTSAAGHVQRRRQVCCESDRDTVRGTRSKVQVDAAALLADLYEASTGQSMGWSFRRDRVQTGMCSSIEREHFGGALPMEEHTCGT